MQSPRTQALMAPPNSVPMSTDEHFRQVFEDMAMQRFSGQFPDIAASLVAFKILDTDADTGQATGSFILDHGGREIHVPVVLQDNNMQPIDMMYDKSSDKFLPLKAEYFDMLQAEDVDYLGDPQKAPDAAASNLDIRNLMVPPATGKYVYASAGSTRSLGMLAAASPRVKRAFLQILERNPDVAAFAMNHIGADLYAQALSSPVEKRAMSTRYKHAAYDPREMRVVTVDTPVSISRELFGHAAGDAMREIAEDGYAISDERPPEVVNRAVLTETALVLGYPDEAGFYRVFLTDGSVKTAYIIPTVKTFVKSYANKSLPTANGSPMVPAANGDIKGSACDAPVYIGITSDGLFIDAVAPFIVEKLPDSEANGKALPFLQDRSVTMPRNGQYGFFMGMERTQLVATPIMRIRAVTITEQNKNMTAELDSAFGKDEFVNIVQNPRSPVQTIEVLQNSLTAESLPSYNEPRYHTGQQGRTVVIMPSGYTFISGTAKINPDMLVRNAAVVHALYKQEVRLSGGIEINVKSAGVNRVSLNGRYMHKLAAVRCLLVQYGLASPDVKALIKTAEVNGDITASVMSPIGVKRYALRVKMANSPAAAAAGVPGPPPMPPPPQGMMPDVDPATGMPIDPTTGMPMDPAAMGMDPMMMGQVPQGPSPTEMAATEVAEQLMGELDQIMQELDKQRQISESQIRAIQMVVDRSNQIAMSMGAPPPMLPPSDMLAVGEPLAAPPEEMMPAGVEDFSAPPQEGPPLDPNSIPQEGPMAMEQAATTLQDPEMFDAASMATLATMGEFGDSVDQYAPELEATLDSVGRLLLSARTNASDLQARMGQSQYRELEQSLKAIFDASGKAVSKLRRVPTSQEQTMSMV